MTGEGMGGIVIMGIVEAIAEVEETVSEDLDMCLHRNISTDAIQELVTHESNAWRLQFETENHIVEVTGNNKILVDGDRIRTVP
jgi:hypothetical protein